VFQNMLVENPNCKKVIDGCSSGVQRKLVQDLMLAVLRFMLSEK
jgi:hypothetical protein